MVAVMKLLVKVVPTPWDWLKMCVIAWESGRNTHLSVSTHTQSESLLHYAHRLLIFCHLSIRWELAREYGNERPARKIKLSALFSSVPPFSSSLQTDDRSKLSPFTPLFSLHPSSLNHFSLSHTSLSNKSVVFVMLLFISIRPVASLFLRFLQLVVSLRSFHLSLHAILPACHRLSATLTLMNLVLRSLFPLPLSSSFSPPVSNTLYNQSDGPSSFPPSIPKPLSPFCSLSFPRFPPVSFLH